MDVPRPTRRNRTPVTREEGERRLVDATIELAREQPYGELSAREIARRADMNHGYVHVWFGSKAGLIDAACERHATRLADSLSGIPLAVAIVQSPDVEVMFRLLARLQNEPGGIELAQQRRRPMVDLIAAQLERTANLSPQDAETVATLSIATAAGIVAVGQVLAFDVTTMVNSWRRVIGAFASE